MTSCPRCVKPLTIRTNSRDGRKFLGCTGFRDGCRYTKPYFERERPEFVPSSEQRLIMDDVVGTEGHILVKAGAGTGKSTTAINSLWLLPPESTKVYTCFSKVIATDFARRPDVPPGTSVSTMHSIGYSILRQHFPAVSAPDRDKTANVIAVLAGTEPELEKRLNHPIHGPSYLSSLIDLTRHCKGALADGKDGEVLRSLCEQYDIEDHGKTIFPYIPTIMEMCKSFVVNEVLIIDFDDMIWLPIVLDMTFPRCDFCVVDECQDLSPARQRFTLKIVGDQGRIMCIGDEFQSIFGFAGADTQSMYNLETMLLASGKPLSIRSLSYTRRVPQSGVDHVNRHYPEIPFHAFDDAGEGWIKDLAQADIYEELQVGDLLMSRVNAPLVAIFFRLIKRKIRTAIAGKQEDIEALLSAIRGLKARSIPQLLEKAEKARAKELKRLQTKPKPSLHLIEACNDKWDIIREIAGACNSVGELEPTVKSMFADVTGPNKQDRVLLSSVHRAKGLEAQRTFVLQANMPHPKAATPEDMAQERNIWYVAHTRHKEGMYLVH